MKLTTVISLVATGAMVSAFPFNQSDAALQERSKEIAKKAAGDCVQPLLCCGTLTTPLDPVVDPILKPLGIDLANIVGSVGLACHPYDASCANPPQCCTEINLLSGTVALGCANSK